MYEELKNEAIINKVGGRFKLSTLIQKRLVQLTQGARPLVNTAETDKMAIALQEIQEDRIFLDGNNEVGVAETTQDGNDTPELDLENL